MMLPLHQQQQALSQALEQALLLLWPGAAQQGAMQWSVGQSRPLPTPACAQAALGLLQAWPAGALAMDPQWKMWPGSASIAAAEPLMCAELASTSTVSAEIENGGGRGVRMPPAVLLFFPLTFLPSLSPLLPPIFPIFPRQVMPATLLQMKMPGALVQCWTGSLS